MRKILVVTGDAGESYEALYAAHRFREAGFLPVVAAPSKRRLHLVMHDFEPGWDTYVERPGYSLEAVSPSTKPWPPITMPSYCWAAERRNTSGTTQSSWS